MEHHSFQRRYQVTSVERKDRFPWSVTGTIYHTVRSWPYFRLVRAVTPVLFGPKKELMWVPLPKPRKRIVTKRAKI